MPCFEESRGEIYLDLLCGLPVQSRESERLLRVRFREEQGEAQWGRAQPAYVYLRQPWAGSL